MSRKITTTTEVAGFNFAVRASGTSTKAPKVAIDIQHVDGNGAQVYVPRATAQTVRRSHVQGQPIPPRPVDKSLVAVLAMPQFAELPQMLADFATAYEALEYPATPPGPEAS